jgi:hypothetical protein
LPTLIKGLIVYIFTGVENNKNASANSAVPPPAAAAAAVGCV